MRIIGGQWKGHRFQPPKKTPARPTTDIAKEGLFNILVNNWEIEEVDFLDLFGGTGSISYEMCSRGCKSVDLVEKSKLNTNFITGFKKKLDLPIRIYLKDVFKYINTCKKQYNLIFAGPPYGLDKLDEIPDLVLKAELIKPDGWLILEHNPNHKFEKHPNFIHVRNYGSTIFSIFKP